MKRREEKRGKERRVKQILVDRGVLGLVGTLDPALPTPLISLDALINLQDGGEREKRRVEWIGVESRARVGVELVGWF